MALRYYIPYFLEREKTNFKQAKGNYLIDFRDKGDSISDADLVCEGIAFRKLRSLEDLNLNVIPFEVNSSETHITGVNEFYRYFTCDLLVFSEESSNISTIYLKPVESFTYSDKTFEYIAEENKLTLQVTFTISSYNGNNPNKTLRTVFRSIPYLEDSLFIHETSPNRLESSISTTENLTITTSSPVSSTERRIFGDLILEAEPKVLSELQTITTKLNSELFSLPVTATEEEKTEYIKTIESNFRSSNIYLRESFPDISISITPISKIVKENSVLKFPNEVSNPLTDVYTNYMSYLFLNTEEPDETRSTLALTTKLEANTGLYSVINFKTLRNLTNDSSVIPKYNLYSNLDNLLPFPFHTIQQGIQIKNFEKDVSQTLKVKDLDTGIITQTEVVLSTEQGINKTINSSGIVAVVKDLDLYLYSLNNKKTQFSITYNTIPEVDLTSVITSDFGNDIVTSNSYSYLNSKISEGILTTFSDPLQNIEDRVVKTVTTDSRDKVTCLINKEVFESSLLTFIESAPVINRLRHYFDTINSKIIPFNINFIVSPPNTLRIFNYSSSPAFIGIEDNLVDITEKKENRFETQEADIYSITLKSGDNSSRPSATDFLEGSPITLKIFNLSVLNQHYLKIDIKDNNEIIDSVRDNIETDINVLVNKLNQVLRKYNVLSAKYNEDSIVIFKTNGDSAMLDIYLYDNATIASQPPLVSHLNINTKLLPFNSETFGSTVVAFPLDLPKNTSYDYYYFEDSNRQPILLKNTEEVTLESEFSFQINPTSGASSLRIKLETNLTSLAYNIITVGLPPFTLYSDNIQDYYNQLKTNIEIVITSLLGSNSGLSVKVSQGLFQAPAPAITSEYSITLTNTDSRLRQLKIVTANSAYIYSTSKTPNIPICYEHYTAVPNIFSEFVGTPFTDGISFWLNGV